MDAKHVLFCGCDPAVWQQNGTSLQLLFVISRQIFWFHDLPSTVRRCQIDRNRPRSRLVRQPLRLNSRCIKVTISVQVVDNRNSLLHGWNPRPHWKHPQPGGPH